MTESPPTSGLQSGGERRMSPGYHSRSERRSTRRLARRRRQTTRVLYIVAPVMVAVVTVAVLFLVFGGSSGDGSSTGPTTSTTSGGIEGASALLVLKQDAVTTSALLLYPGPPGGVVLGIPGLTLLRSGHGFSTVTALGDVGGEDGKGGSTLARAVSDALGVPVAASASVEWAKFRAVLEGAGIGPLPPVALDPNGADVARTAEALALFLSHADSQSRTDLWERVTLGGEVAGFKEAAATAMQSVGTSAWFGAAVGGRVAGEAEGRYLEPDIPLAKGALAGSGGSGPVMVELQNGSGVVAVTEQAGEMLMDLGFEFLPARNADGFPGVEITRIISAPDAVLQAGLVQNALGVGTISSDDSLDPGRIVVVLGRDFSPQG